MLGGVLVVDEDLDLGGHVSRHGSEDVGGVGSQGFGAISVHRPFLRSVGSRVPVPGRRRRSEKGKTGKKGPEIAAGQLN
jgi:hypothetical protein